MIRARAETVVPQKMVDIGNPVEPHELRDTGTPVLFIEVKFTETQLPVQF